MIIAQSLLRMGYIVGQLAFGSGTPISAPAGVQVRTRTSIPVTGAAIIPVDVSVPTFAEGVELLALATTIRPTRPDSQLLVQVSLPWVTADAIVKFTGAIWRDPGGAASADGVSTISIAAANDFVGPFQVSQIFNSESTEPTTFRFRYGPSAAATVSILPGGGLFGLIPGATMTVTEIVA